ncbi:22kda glyco [Fusarium longipes]|uniref:22kda glyco n=1 Tax=Fusarium longipes TaxID=694270 RepID=A0A395T3Y0_9HYPO|nr:22kda glyco [Fusarium longipes]
MKFSVAALFTAAASVSAVSNFEVRDFTASCIPHSTFCEYSFKVIQPNSMDTWKNAPECLARAQSTNYLLPDIKGGKCKDSSRTFDINHTKKGLVFTISQPISPKSDTVGRHIIPTKELTQSTTPNAEVQSYKGPKSFQLTQVN